MHRLKADGAVLHPLEPALLLLRGAATGRGGLPPATPLLASVGAAEGLTGLGGGGGGGEERPGGAREGGGGRRHGELFCPGLFFIGKHGI